MLLLLLKVVLLKHLLYSPRLQLFIASLTHIACILSRFAQTGLANKPIPIVRPRRFSTASTERINYISSNTIHVFRLSVGWRQPRPSQVIRPVWLKLLYRHIWPFLGGLFLRLLRGILAHVRIIYRLPIRSLRRRPLKLPPTLRLREAAFFHRGSFAVVRGERRLCWEFRIHKRRLKSGFCLKI